MQLKIMLQYGEEILADKNDDNNITGIIHLIKESSTLDFSDYKKNTIIRRTKRRASSHNFITLATYLDFLKSNPIEVEALIKEFLISVTSFFRDKEPFEFIKKNIIPEILQKLKPGQEIKMWIAGCATGEEVYSLAILLAEQLAGNFENTAVKIFATDIDKIALGIASKGIYTKDVVKSVSPERLEKYFTIEGDMYKINQVIRKMIIFAHHDLLKNPPYCNMHFISCRNLLIYMTPILQEKIFNMFLFGLKKDGYLFLGSSENPMPIIKNLEVVSKKYKIYKNLESKRTISFDAFSLPELLDVKRQPTSFSHKVIAKNFHPALLEIIQTSLAQELGYLAICIDEDMNVIQSYGDTKYLIQKHFTINLPELLPKPLAIAFNTLRSSVLKNKKKETVKGIKIVDGDNKLNVCLTIMPLILKREKQIFLLVTFVDHKLTGKDQVSDKVFDEKTYQNMYITNLEEELKELKEKLNTAYEQLSSSNENVQSFNEELLSANEEMQSTNEEMQSVNEELHTINSEYQVKNKELLEINDDLNNYFRSNINGQLFIDKDLKLMKFSPGAVKQINLLETDIGRPISNITTNIKFETIAEDIKKVLSDGSVITKEIETNDGKWYQIMTMPYVRQANHLNNGAIITFNDITELKNTQQELNKSNRMLGMATSSAGMGT
ncbi:chemotaxis methyl-accepting protein methylase [Pedobacter sp. CG_S7]